MCRMSVSVICRRWGIRGAFRGDSRTNHVMEERLEQNSAEDERDTANDAERLGTASKGAKRGKLG